MKEDSYSCQEESFYRIAPSQLVLIINLSRAPTEVAAASASWIRIMTLCNCTGYCGPTYTASTSFLQNYQTPRVSRTRLRQIIEERLNSLEEIEMPLDQPTVTCNLAE